MEKIQLAKEEKDNRGRQTYKKKLDIARGSILSGSRSRYSRQADTDASEDFELFNGSVLGGSVMQKSNINLIHGKETQSANGLIKSRRSNSNPQFLSDYDKNRQQNAYLNSVKNYSSNQKEGDFKKKSKLGAPNILIG